MVQLYQLQTNVFFKTSARASFEHQARPFLEAKGLTFIAANQNLKCGELDLIMNDKNYRLC